jgi:hypothetical protein
MTFDEKIDKLKSIIEDRGITSLNIYCDNTATSEQKVDWMLAILSGKNSKVIFEIKGKEEQSNG